APDVQLTLGIAGTQTSLDTPDAQMALDSSATFTGPDDAHLARWVHGVLVHMRRRGAIEHLWFDKFRSEAGNRWWITGGRRRNEGMPGFGRGSSAPGYPILASPGRDSDLEPIASPRGWYARWTAKVLGVTNQEGAVLSRLLFTELHRRDVLGQVADTSGAPTYHLPAATVIARPLTDAEVGAAAVTLTALRCSLCRDAVHAAPTIIRSLTGGPCMVAHCDGTLDTFTVEDNFYRQMYASTDITRVVAREHTSLLPDTTRLAYENEFKQEDPPPNAPN